MALQAGRAELPIVPTLVKSFSRDLASKMAGPATKTANKAGTDAGRQFGQRFGRAVGPQGEQVGRRFGRSVTPHIERAGGDAGRRFGLRFNKQLGGGFSASAGIARKAAGLIGAAFAGAAVVGGIRSAISAASDLQETLNKNTVVFGNSAASIVAWSKNSAQSFGLSQNAALAAAAQFGEMFHQLGFTQKQSAATSKSLVQTAADLGSFHNVDPSDVLDRIGAALRGEYDSLQQLIPNINAARVEQEALRMTHKTSAKELTAAEKATAVLAIVQKDGANAAGDFAKTSENAANRQRILAARMQDVKAAIGGVLLPAWNALLGLMLDKVFPAFQAVGKGIKALVDLVVKGDFTGAFAKAFNVTEDAPIVGTLLRIREAALGIYNLVAKGDFTGAFARAFNVAEDSPLVDTILRIRDGFISLKRFIPAVVAGLSALLVASAVAKALSLVGLAIKAIGVAVAANPLGLLALAAIAVGTALLFFFRNTEAGQKVLQTLWGVAKTLAQVFLTQVVPAVASAVGVFVRGLMPGLKSFGAVLAANVLPVLKVVAIIIGVTLYVALTKILPLLLRIAGPVLGFFFKQLGQTIQWIGNLVRLIGRVLAWLARWVTGTETTGDAIRELGRRVGVFASNMVGQWQTITRQVGAALGFLRDLTITVLSAMIRFWLRWAGNIVDAAATALGWVPGIGPKLRAAQTKFHEFAASVNASLDRIKNKNVTVDATASIHTTANTRQALNALGIKGYGTRFLAVGGPVRGPGTGTSDSIPAMLSAGEHVWTAKEVKAAGGHTAVEGIRERVARGYARGGPVFDIQARTGRRGNGAAAFYDAAVEATRRLSGPVARKLAEGLAKGLSRLMDKASFGGNAGIKRFIKSVDRLPYIWGGAGPGGYDCSGLVGAVYGKMRGTGGGQGQRYFTTGTISTAVPGLKPGLGGTLNIGVTSGSGHMAGSYGGLGFEARSTATGIFTGAAARKPSSFARTFHMAKGGPVDLAMLSELARRGGIDLGGDTDRLRINGQVFDRGGVLRPGFNLVNNQTGRPEPLVPAQGSAIDYDKLGQAVAFALTQRPIRASVDANQARFGLREAQRRDGIRHDQQVR